MPVPRVPTAASTSSHRWFVRVIAARRTPLDSPPNTNVDVVLWCEAQYPAVTTYARQPSEYLTGLSFRHW